MVETELEQKIWQVSREGREKTLANISQWEFKSHSPSKQTDFSMEGLDPALFGLIGSW
jgi:hypothetical protein